MQLYDVLVEWLVYSRGNYLRRTQWVRRIPADTLQQATCKALANYTDKICPSVSMCWPIWPQEYLK